MMMRGRHAIVSLLSVAAVAGTACTDFEDPSTVIDLRVLGIMAEPSEIILDADVTDPTMPTVDPNNNLAVTMTPLIIDPAGRAVSYTVVACPNNPFGAAPPGPGGMGGGGPYPSGGARTSVGSAMCDEDSPTTWPIITEPINVPANATAAFTFQPTIDNLVAAFRADVFVDQFRHIHGGFDLGMPLTIQLNIDAGGEKLVAIKRVLYWAVPISDAQLPNQTPTIAALQRFDERDPVTGDLLGAPEILTAAAPIEVRAGSKPWIDPAFDPSLAEPYVTTVLDPATHLAVPRAVPRETLRYAYYATAGTFAPFRTSSEVTPGFVGTAHLESQYSAPAIDDAPPDGLVTIWVVVRDDRGGESWLTRQLKIVP